MADGALPGGAVAVAEWGARALLAAGALLPVPGQASLGRTDSIAVLVREPRAPGGYALAGGGAPAAQEAVAAVALAAAGALAALPEVLGGGLAAPPLLQLARYGPDGAAYPRHADNDERLAGSPEYTQGPPGLRVCDREVTALLYLNAEGGAWEPGRDGGTLRLWAPGSDAAGGGAPDLELAPEAGRLVLFDSRAVEHEVAPAFRERWALSAWYPAAAALEKG